MTPITAIIFDERSYAKELLRSGFSSFMSWYDLLVLAKYYRFLGFKTSQVRKELASFCKKFNPEYNDVVSGLSLDSAVRKSEKQELKLPMDVMITESELNIIHNVHNYRYEKILFVLLVISRNNKLVNHNHNPEYYVNQNFSVILPLAGVYANKQERDFIKHDLFNKGFILAPEPSRMMRNNKKENYKLLYANEDSGSAILVDDLEQIINFYKPLCENCGKQVDRQVKKAILCSGCYADKVRVDTLKRVQNYRKKKIDLV